MIPQLLYDHYLTILGVAHGARLNCKIGADLVECGSIVKDLDKLIARTLSDGDLPQDKNLLTIRVLELGLQIAKGEWHEEGNDQGRET